MVESGTTTWTNGWYVVNSNVTFSSRITVTGTVHLILADNCKLTAENGGNNNSTGGTITINGGKISATGGTGDWGGDAGIGGGGRE